MELVRHTRAQFELLFLLYPVPDLTIDKMLDSAVANASGIVVTDEYGAVHRVWRISDPSTVRAIQESMADKKLLIADGHHRYETALAFRNENPGLADAASVPMTFVNMHSPGLEILATHRVVQGLTGFDPATFLGKVQGRRLGSLDELRELFRVPARPKSGSGSLCALVKFVCTSATASPASWMSTCSTITCSAHCSASAKKRSGTKSTSSTYAAWTPLTPRSREAADAAFLLEPTTMDQVASVAFSGGVMPQKSTDFYPKLLSGLTIHKLER